LGLVFEVNQEGGRTTSIPGPYEKIARPPANRQRYAVLVDELDSGEVHVGRNIREEERKEVTKYGFDRQESPEADIMIGSHRQCTSEADGLSSGKNAGWGRSWLL
jgi:hypothetical protein